MTRMFKFSQRHKWNNKQKKMIRKWLFNQLNERLMGQYKQTAMISIFFY
jgi:hypothetical protein